MSMFIHTPYKAAKLLNEGRGKNTPVYMWASDLVEENPWFQNEPLAEVGRALSPPRDGWDPLRVSSMWHKLNLSWRFLGSCFLSATQSVYPQGGGVGGKVAGFSGAKGERQHLECFYNSHSKIKALDASQDSKLEAVVPVHLPPAW